MEERNYSEVVVPTLLEKIPNSIRLTITRGREYLEWTLGDMLEAFLVEVELREDHCLTQHRAGLREGKKVPYTSSALFTTNIAERKKLLIKFGICFYCINKGHRARDCKVVVKCKNCRGSHNTWLCDTNLQQPSGGNSDQPSTVNTPSSLLVGTESRITLQTAQALITGNVQGRVRVLFDSGSHKTFVTAKAASNYGLEILRREWVTISTFGEKTREAGLREVVQFDVMPLQANCSLRLEAYVVPVISNISNEHVEVVKNDFPHLRDLWFSDVCRTKDELEIDLLIGSDYLWEFQKGRTVRGEPEKPIAVETELGRVLSGPSRKKEPDSRQEVVVNFVAQDNIRKSHKDRSAEKCSNRFAVEITTYA